MSLPEIVQQTTPLRPLLIFVGCCVLSLLSERTRRAGGFLLFAGVSMYFINMGMQHVMKAYAPPPTVAAVPVKR